MHGTITQTQRGQVTVHTYTAPETGWRAASHLIELPAQLILVDTPLTPQYTREVLDHPAGLTKPITRLYISHAHPDHFGGSGLIDAPAYALAPVREAVNTTGDATIRGSYMLTAGHDDDKPVPATTIGHTVEARQETIDGVRFSFQAAGPAESACQLTIGLPDEGILIAQDLIYNGVHAFLGEQNLDAWIQAINALETSPYDIILPGHGLPGDRSLYAATRAYLTAARTALAQADGPGDLNRRLQAAYPDHDGTAMQPLQNFFLFPARH